MQDFANIIDRLCLCPHWERPHIIRYNLTYQYLVRTGAINQGMNILDVGGPSPFRAALREMGYRVFDMGTTDLRYRFADSGLMTGAPQMNLITALEVFEHLSDREVQEGAPPDQSGKDWLDQRATFNHTGQISFLSECRKILVDDGSLVMTTPNAIGWCCLAKMCAGEPPNMYQPHVKEMTQDQVGYCLDQAGLACIHAEGFNAWPQLDGNDKRWRAKMLATVLKPGKIREDMILYRCVKKHN